MNQEGGGLSHVCPAWAIIRARARVIGPVKLGPCVGASSAGVSVRAPGRSPAWICRTSLWLVLVWIAFLSYIPIKVHPFLSIRTPFSTLPQHFWMSDAQRSGTNLRRFPKGDFFLHSSPHSHFLISKDYMGSVLSLVSIISSLAESSLTLIWGNETILLVLLLLLLAQARVANNHHQVHMITVS